MDKNYNQHEAETFVVGNENPKTKSNKSTTKRSKAKGKIEAFKEKECKVIAYDKRTKVLDVFFDNFGIRLFNVPHFDGTTATIKYKGEIGTAGFEYRI